MSNRPPNILLLIPDQHRADWTTDNPALSLRTPTFDALAARGVTFTNAITPSPLCGPARACLASGLFIDQCRVFGNQNNYPLTQATYYAALRDAGYEVAGVGKFDLHKGTKDWNLDGSRLIKELGFTRGIDSEGKWDGVKSGAEVPMGPYMAFLHRRGLAATHVADMLGRRGGSYGNNYGSTDPTPLPDDAYSDNWIAENGLSMLADLPRGTPWHLAVNFTGPHEPMDVTASMHQAWRGVNFPPPHKPQPDMPPEVHQEIRRNYAAMIANIDRQCGRLIDAVAARGELDNTLIVYTSDHGEMLGDHGLWAKQHWRQPSIAIPLVIAGPGVSGGIHTDSPIALHDLAATFIDYASTAAPDPFVSRSARPMLEGRTTRHRDYAISGLDNWRLAFDGRYKLILTRGKPPTLFDLLEDPQEDHDRAADFPAVVARLRQAMIEEHADASIVGAA